MTQQEFIKILQQKEVPSIEALETAVRNYPYCQSLHVALLRAMKQQDHSDTRKQLSKTATYLSDRSFLKEIFSPSVTALISSPEPSSSLDLNQLMLKQDQPELESMFDEEQEGKIGEVFQADLNHLFEETKAFEHDLDTDLTLESDEILGRGIDEQVATDLISSEEDASLSNQEVPEIPAPSDNDETVSEPISKQEEDALTNDKEEHQLTFEEAINETETPAEEVPNLSEETDTNSINEINEIDVSDEEEEAKTVLSETFIEHTEEDLSESAEIVLSEEEEEEVVVEGNSESDTEQKNSDEEDDNVLLQSEILEVKKKAETEHKSDKIDEVFLSDLEIEALDDEIEFGFEVDALNANEFDAFFEKEKEHHEIEEATTDEHLDNLEMVEDLTEDQEQQVIKETIIPENNPMNESGIEFLEEDEVDDEHHQIKEDMKKKRFTESDKELKKAKIKSFLQRIAEQSLEEDDMPSSETLASLLAQQGKIERSIRMYQQLILKNPQKKTYFAQKIKELIKLL